VDVGGGAPGGFQFASGLVVLRRAGAACEAGGPRVQRVGPGLDVAATLEGRSEELHLIRTFLDTAATGGGSLVLLGEPGTGKTVLVDAAEQEASAAGTEVLRAAGVEFEVDVSFSALNQLLLPLRDHLSSIDEAHRAVLVVALGLTDESTAAGQRAAAENIVANAVLALLREAALVRPVLAVVDDVPWLDRSSSAVLAFVARRLRATRVGLIATARSGAATLFRHAGLVEHELGPLSDEAASRLLTTHFPALPKRARARVLAEAQGNPLALLELPKTESHPYSGATQPQATHVSLSRRLQMLFGARIAELPPAARHVLLLAALDGTGEVEVLVAAAGERALGDLAVAEGAVLVFTYGGTRIAFRHPLTRAAVVALATSEERRAAHRALGAAFPFDVERRAAHLAQATITPDESVAALLTQASRRLLRRGDASGAAAALARAASLSPSQLDRHRRLDDQFQG
jgi:hypothetical protein